jgi:hypothetical protein
MNKDSNMKNRVGVEVMELDSITKKQAAQEITSRDG